MLDKGEEDREERRDVVRGDGKENDSRGWTGEGIVMALSFGCLQRGIHGNQEKLASSHVFYMYSRHCFTKF